MRRRGSGAERPDSQLRWREQDEEALEGKSTIGPHLRLHLGEWLNSEYPMVTMLGGQSIKVMTYLHHLQDLAPPPPLS